MSQPNRPHTTARVSGHDEDERRRNDSLATTESTAVPSTITSATLTSTTLREHNPEEPVLEGESSTQDEAEETTGPKVDRKGKGKALTAADEWDEEPSSSTIDVPTSSRNQASQNSETLETVDEALGSALRQETAVELAAAADTAAASSGSGSLGGWLQVWHRGVARRDPSAVAIAGEDIELGLVRNVESATVRSTSHVGNAGETSASGAAGKSSAPSPRPPEGNTSTAHGGKNTSTPSWRRKTRRRKPLPVQPATVGETSAAGAAREAARQADDAEREGDEPSGRRGSADEAGQERSRPPARQAADVWVDLHG